MQRVHCVAMSLKTSMDSHKDATACYELKIPVMCPTQPLTLAAFLLGFHSKNRAPPAKNGSATATITIKPERLAHLCEEQALLYPWMCFTSWFELHRSQESQDERFSTPSSLEVTDLFAVSDRGVFVMIAVAL